jgi:hypothetical protein
MSWHYSRALEEVYWGENSSGGEPSAPSSWIPTHGTFWSPDKTTDVSPPSRSGMTYALLTDDRGEAVLTWFLEGFPVRILARQEKELESEERGAVCGLARIIGECLDSSSWKTHLNLWEEVLPWSLVILPTRCWELPAHHRKRIWVALRDGQRSSREIRWRISCLSEPQHGEFRGGPSPDADRLA